MSRKTLQLLALLFMGLILLAACGGPQNEGTAVPDGAAAAARPQLIEFYADW